MSVWTWKQAAVLIVVPFVAAGCRSKDQAPGADGGTVDGAASSPVSSVSAIPAANKLPPDPPPRIADRASEAPELEAKMIADSMYATLWDDRHQADRDLVLTGVSEALVTEEVGNNQVFIPETVAKELERRKLLDIVLNVTATIPRTGALPKDFDIRARAAIKAVSSSPQHGVWTTKKINGAPVDYSGLAYWLEPGDADYLREHLTGRRSGPIGFEALTKPTARATRPYLARERAALERLALIATLTPDETARLAELKASKLGDGPPEQIDIAKLLKEYGSNEVRADDAYRGHVVEFSGVAGAIERGTIGGITLGIGTGKPFETPVVRCFFEDSQTNKVKAINKGDRVRARGKVDGLAIDVLIRYCELVP